MRVFKSKWFDKWATGEGLNDKTLLAAVAEMEDGLVDARLGGHVVKKRVALPCAQSEINDSRGQSA